MQTSRYDIAPSVWGWLKRWGLECLGYRTEAPRITNQFAETYGAKQAKQDHESGLGFADDVPLWAQDRYREAYIHGYLGYWRGKFS